MRTITPTINEERYVNVAKISNEVAVGSSKVNLMKKFKYHITKNLVAGLVVHDVAGFDLDLRLTTEILITYSQEFVEKCKEFFRPEYNNLEVYNYYRFVFNEMKQELLSPRRKQNYACLFIYLNLHAATGLVRNNKHGDFSLQYGKHQKIYFPEQELLRLVPSANIGTGVDDNFVTGVVRIKLALKEILYGYYKG